MAQFVTAEEFKAHLRLDSRDFVVDALEIWNEDATGTAATVEVTSSAIILTKTGGISPGTDTLSFSSYSTIATMLAAIEATATLAVPRQWVAVAYVPTDSPTSALQVLASVSALGYAARQATEIVDNRWLDKILTRTSDFVEQWTHRTFDSTVHTQEVYDGVGTELLILNNFPVTTLTLIQEYNGSDWSDVDSDSYRLDGDNGLVYKVESTATLVGYVSSVWSLGKRNFRVTYTAGYTTLPADFDRLCLDIAAEAYHKAGHDPRIVSDKLGPYSRKFTEGLLSPGLLDRLNFWARWEDF